MEFKVGILLADGFEEIEAITVIDVLRRGGFKVETLALQNIIVEGAHRIKLKVDEIIFARGDFLFDALILPGGEPGTTNLEKSASVKRMVLYHYENDRIIGAMCAAPRILAQLNLLNGIKATCYPAFKEILGPSYTGLDVENSGKIITGSGPGTALSFALTLLGQMAGVAIAEDMAKKMLVPWPLAPSLSNHQASQNNAEPTS